MPSFGELLTEYMTRTGISDSELARHLGVSRQTIFRWKEGLTARPRVRQEPPRFSSINPWASSVTRQSPQGNSRTGSASLSRTARHRHGPVKSSPNQTRG